MTTCKPLPPLPIATSPRRKNGQKTTLILMGVVGTLMMVEMSVHGILLGALICTAAIIIGFPSQSQYVLTNFNQVEKKYRINPYLILFLVLSVIFAIDFAAAPADAQFMNNAQNWMKSAFGGGNNQVGNIVDLIFNILRALFIVYVGISLVRVIQAARNDEDWQTLARTPLIIVMAVFVADAITGLIVNTGGA